MGSNAKANKGLVSPASYLLMAAWWALFAGLLEVAVLAIRHLTIPIMKVGPHYVWTIPIMLTGVFLVPGLFFVVAARLLGRMDLRTLATFCCSALAFLNLLILIPRLHHFAALALAAGVATQTTHYANKHYDGYARLVRRTVPFGAVLVLMLGLSVPLSRFAAERQALAALPPGTAGAPNVLFITLDTVRARSLSLYGYGRPTSPHLDALARTAVVFDNAISTASWTLPSHASMFTGRWAHELSADYGESLDGTYPTLAESLSGHGYEAAGFVANLGYCSAETGLARGFSHYEDYTAGLGQAAASSTLVRTIADNFRLRLLLENDEHLNRKTADNLNADVLNWLDRDRSRPFFVFLNYFDAHDPYLPPPPFDAKFGPSRGQGKHSPLHHWLYDPAATNRPDLGEAAIQEETDAYDGAIAYLDDRLNALFDSLKQRGLWDNTLVIITADHGEEFGEHRVFEHGYSLYHPGIHVPLLVSFPGRVPAGTRIKTPVSLRDLPATVVGLLDMKTGAPFPGASLARHWQTSTPGVPLDGPILAEVNRASGQRDWYPVSKGDMKSVVFQNLHYIRNGDGSEELYDYNQDPSEQTNLAASNAQRDVLEQFGRRLRELLGR